MGKVVASRAACAVAGSIPAEAALIYTMQGVLPMRVEGATSQLDLL